MSVMTRLQTHVRSATLGALWGLGGAVLALCVGLIRMLVALVSGAHVSGLSAGDVRELEFYVGGFVAAGVFIGFLWPALPGRVGKIIAFMFGGVILIFAIAVGDQGSFAALDRTDRIAMTLLGMVFGAAAAYGYLRNRSA